MIGINNNVASPVVAVSSMYVYFLLFDTICDAEYAIIAHTITNTMLDGINAIVPIPSCSCISFVNIIDIGIIIDSKRSGANSVYANLFFEYIKYDIIVVNDMYSNHT